MKNKISNISASLCVLASILLVVSIFVAIWRIELDAPQYPEGLVLKIYANGLGGDVAIINGLNHYIGMQNLDNNNFIEFTILPYLIGFFSLLALLVSLIRKQGILNFLLIAFICFGVVAMIDFWRWEYDYGHNLNPNAAIIVPGMAYQPPLIGFKQLLNFGAYSIPDIGGWLFIAAGVCILAAVINEKKIHINMKKNRSTITMLLLGSCFSALIGCADADVSPIRINKDRCDNCEMTIANGKFGAELITQKGRIYKFDDIHCLQNYRKDNASVSFVKFLIHDYSLSDSLIDAQNAYYVKHEMIKSPMGGNIAAFADKTKAQSLATQYQVSVLSWKELPLE